MVTLPNPKINANNKETKLTFKMFKCKLFKNGIAFTFEISESPKQTKT
jgi:hypothetical protein